jgi:CTD small phosphatase-like protein 2
MFRDSCAQTEEGAYIKDLRVIANRNMQDMLLVDNAIYSFGLQLPNGVPILNFYDNK